MKELCVPVPILSGDEIAEITVVVKGKMAKYNYRIESFPWEVEDELSQIEDPLAKSLTRIYRLKQAIESYDKNWELIQIFNPAENDTHVQVLYRKR